MTGERDSVLEHVLEGQRELQVSVSELHVLVANYHAEAQRGNETMGVLIAHLVKRCETIEAAAEKAAATSAERVAALEKRVHDTEKKLLVAMTTCAVVWTIGGLLAKYGSTLLKVLG